MPVQSLVNFFNSYVALSEAETAAVTERTIERTIKRRQFILQEGDVCRGYFFVATGCFKMYAVDSKGSEHILQFATENNWIADIGSVHTAKASKLNIEALEPSVVLLIQKPDLIFLYANFPVFSRIFKVVAENNFVELQDRVLQNISSTAEERYLTFINRYPDLSNRLPNTQIASYLGITPEFLSTIRKSIATRQL